LKGKLINTAKKQETAVLVAVQTQGQRDYQAKEYLDELEFLAQTAGVKTLKQFKQKLQHPDPKTFVGKGKLEDIKLYVKEYKIDTVIFDDELSPSQVRNLEKVLDCKILDRANLILDIFAKRAQTAQAKAQVELAQTQYLLPRLTRMWTHLTKHAGGVGTRGPGEKEIETDRRLVRDRISLLKARLDGIDKQNLTRRKNRDGILRVALVGYTNVGKSTIMNLLTKSDVLAEDKLFATLDSTVRKVVLDNTPFLLSDTVGFIRKLPHMLVESFKSTLDEVREADLLLHVVDISHPNFEEHITVVKETLREIGAEEKPTIMVMNKIDLYKPEEHISYAENEEEEDMPTTLSQLKRSWMAKENAPVVFISAQKKENIQELRDKLITFVKSLSQFQY
jgi:GTP-binding protein HflX